MLKAQRLDYVKQVCNPYDSAHSAGRSGIMICGPWDDAIYALINKLDARALYINTSKGWQGTDFRFLSKLDTIEELNIITSRCEHLEALEQMTALQELALTCATDSVVDFAKLPRLQQLYLYYWSGADSVFNATALTELYLDEAKLKDYSRLANLGNLHTLTIANASIDDLTPLCALSKLERLELLNCRKLSRFDELAALTALKRLTVRGSKALENLDFVTAVQHLEVLVISDNGSIDTLAPVGYLKKLKALSFSGNTNIADGDLSVLTGLKQLSMLMFASRRHYTHKLIKPWNWNNLDQPDTLLESKKRKIEKKTK